MGLNWTRLVLTGPDGFRPDQTRPDWNGSVLNRSDWTNPDQTGFEWTRVE